MQTERGNIPRKFYDTILRFEMEIDLTPHSNFGSLPSLTNTINELVDFLEENIEPVPPFFKHKEVEIDKFRNLIPDLNRNSVIVPEKIHTTKQAIKSLLEQLLERLNMGVVILCKTM